MPKRLRRFLLFTVSTRFEHARTGGASMAFVQTPITNADGIISPDDLNTLALPDGMNWRQGVIIEGKAPVWLYSFLVHECHPAKWVGCYDPRLGAVVVSTHCKEVSVGQVLDVTL